MIKDKTVSYLWAGVGYFGMLSTLWWWLGPIAPLLIFFVTVFSLGLIYHSTLEDEK